MDTVSVSLDVLAGYIGKPVSELQSALMIDDKEGKKVFLDQSNIDKYVGESLRTRLADQKKLSEKEFSSFGKRTAWDEVEDYLVTTYGVPKGTDWKKGLEVALTEAKSKAQTTDEVVKASEPYKALAAKVTEAENKLQETKKEFRDKKIDEYIDKLIEEAVSDETLALALPEDKVIRQNQLKSFKLQLKANAKLDLTENDQLIPVDQSGKQLEDQNYLPLSAKALVSTNAKTFWPTKSGQPDRTPPPAGQPGGQQGADPGQNGNKFPKWTSSEEFSKFIDTSLLEGKDVTFVKEATAAFESQSK